MKQDQNQLDRWGNTPLTICQCGGEQTCSGHKFGPAVRSHFLIHFVVSGSGTYSLNGTSYSLEAGQGFLIEPFVVTTYQADWETPWRYRWVGFVGGEAADLLRDRGLSGKNPIFTAPLEETEQCLSQMEAAYYNDPTRRLLLLSYLYRFLAGIPAAGGQEETENRYVLLAKEYIRHNFSYAITVQDVARYIGLERSYLYRLFQKHVGLSPQQYLLQQRLDYARDMLLSNRYNVTETAFSCGFSSVSHFSNLFKARYRMSPIQYQKGLNTIELE